MTEAGARRAVVDEARSWIGTPYRHLGRAKGPGGGVDCAQLVWAVFHNCGLTPFMPLEPYPRDFMMHRGVERYMRVVLDRAHPAESPLPGDVVLYRVGRLYAHGAIVDEPGWPRIVHAWYAAGLVLADDGNAHRLAGRPHKFFSLW
ncbi:MAG TPA: hydrolase [Stellaceae bacterium]|nr:hydrolase [Stellaceae bacterium]